MHRTLLGVVAGLVLLARAGAAQTPPAIPAEIFPKPTGTYEVGTLDTLWIDQARDEIMTRAPGDKRHVPVRIWYPAERGGTPARYVQRPEEFGARSPFTPVLHVLTNAVLDAPLEVRGGKFPVLLYNHGGGWSRFTATFECEQLASLGYVIVSVDHLGFDKSTLLSNGYAFTADTLEFPKPSGKGMKADIPASWDYLEHVLFPMWVADARFVLDRVEELDRDPRSRFVGRLDLTRIGAFGWSFGGATSVELSIVDPRVKAAIDQDGQLFGEARKRGSTRPVMQMHNTSDPLKGVPDSLRDVMTDMVAQVRRWDSAFQAGSTGPIYDLSIAKTGHGHFSDLTLFFPRDTSALDPATAHRIITEYTVAFFDEYLKGKKSELLGRATPPWAEVALRRAGGQTSR